MLFTHLISTVSVRSFRRVGQRVGQSQIPAQKLRRSNQRIAGLKQVHFKL